MLAALTGPSAGHLRQRGHVDGDSVTVTREVDGGLETVKLSLPGDRHHRPAPQRAALCLAAQHHEGEVQAARAEGACRLRRRCAPRLKTLKVTEPPVRSAGIKVADVDALVAKLKEMGVAA
jgi:electron transfer flavoprotein beta subunit